MVVVTVSTVTLSLLQHSLCWDCVTVVAIKGGCYYTDQFNGCCSCHCSE